MSTTVTSVASHFPSAQNGFTTTLASTISSGAATVPLNSVAGYTNGQVAVFVVDPTDATKKQTFTGIVDTSGVQLTSVVWTAGTNQSHSGGSTVVDYATATHISMMTKGLLVQHTQAGAHGAVTATSLSVSGATTATSLSVTGATTLVGALTVNSWDGWITDTRTWTYVSASSFKVSGVDVTTQFPVGTKIKLTQTTAKYFYVTSTSFSTDTTVNITAGTDYTLANAAITSPTYSYQETPQAFPCWFNYTPVWTLATAGVATIGNGTLAGKFMIIGKKVTVKMRFILGSSSNAANSSNWGFTGPVAAIPSTETQFVGTCYVEDNGVFAYSGFWKQEKSSIANIGNLFCPVTNTSALNITTASPFSWGTSDYFQGMFDYDIA